MLSEGASTGGDSAGGATDCPGSRKRDCMSPTALAPHAAKPLQLRFAWVMPFCPKGQLMRARSEQDPPGQGWHRL